MCVNLKANPTCIDRVHVIAEYIFFILALLVFFLIFTKLNSASFAKLGVGFLDDKRLKSSAL